VQYRAYYRERYCTAVCHYIAGGDAWKNASGLLESRGILVTRRVGTVIKAMKVDCLCVCVSVNGEPWLRPECSEVQQLRAELVTMRDNVERLINRLQLMTSFTATAASATVANDNDTAASDGQYPSNGQLPSNCDVALCHILHMHTTV